MTVDFACQVSKHRETDKKNARTKQHDLRYTLP